MLEIVTDMHSTIILERPFSPQPGLLLAAMLASGCLPNLDARPSPSFFDTFPGLALFKAAVQAAAGDEAGAKQTLNNMVNQFPGVSQVSGLLC